MIMEKDMDGEPELRPLQCQSCKKVYSMKTRGNFETHIKTCGKGQYRCDVCQKCYYSQLSLKNHLKHHLIAAAFKCATCGKEFKTKFKWTLHMKIHKDKSERDRERLKCEYCDKSFAWNSSLSRHMQNHFKSETESYSCSCGMTFSRYTALYSHRKSCSLGQQEGPKETNEILITLELDLHRCQLCNQGFKDRDALDEHVISCDPFSTENISHHGNVISIDEQQGIEQVIAEKMAKIVGNTIKSKAREKDGVSYNENKGKATQEKKLEVKEIGTDQDLEKSDVNIKEDDFIISAGNKTNLSYISKVAGSRKRKMTLKMKGKCSSQKGSVPKTSDICIIPKEQNNDIKETQSESSSSKNVSNVKQMSKKQMEMRSPARRTQRVRKQKQFPGYQVELVGKEMELKEGCPEELAQGDDYIVKKKTVLEEQSKQPEKDVVKLKVIRSEVKLVPLPQNNLSKEAERNLAANELNDVIMPVSKSVLSDAGSLKEEPVTKSTVVSKLKRKVKGRMKGNSWTDYKCETKDDYSSPGRKKYSIIYECKTGTCPRTFNSLKLITSHKKLVHKEIFKHLCSTCGKEFSCFAVYRSHIRMEHSGDNSLTYSLKNIQIIIKDQNGKKGGDISICARCGYRYNKDHEDPDHMCEPAELHYYCPCCDYISKQHEEIASHISGSHKGEYHAIKNKHQYLTLRSKAKEPGWNISQGDTTCEYCQIQLGTNEELRQHLNEKHAVHPFACGLCKSCYGRKNALKRHLLTHISSNLTCDVCKKEFYEKARLDVHMLTHTGERPFQCEICGNRYCSEKAVKKHIMMKHLEHYSATFSNSAVSSVVSKNITAAVCHLCGKSFKSESNLKHHMKEHGDCFVYQCPHCDMTFNERLSYKKHKLLHSTFDFSKQEECSDMSGMKTKDMFRDIKVFEEVHPSGLPFRCKVCDKRFNQVKSTNQHIRTVHMREKDKKFLCPICKRGFAIGAALHNHMRTHTNAKPYRCRVCNKRYRQLAHIRQHLLHHGKAMFKCKICGKDFKIRGNLRAHVKMHCKILPFKCPVNGCSASFQCLYVFLRHFSTCTDSLSADLIFNCNLCHQACSKDNLASHYQRHENEDHFPCEICGIAFKNYPNLYFHKERKKHFLESEQEQCSDNMNSVLFMNKEKLHEYENDLKAQDLMSQYDYIAQEDEQPWTKASDNDSSIYLEHCKDMDNNEGELILIAEQLTHMASGVPFREVIVKATEGTEHLSEIAIDELEEDVQGFGQVNEVTAESTEVPECNIDDDNREIGSTKRTSETDTVTYQIIVEGDHIGVVDEVCNEKGNTNTVDYTAQSNTNEGTVDQAKVITEESINETDEYQEIVEVGEISTEFDNSMVAESSVEVIVDSNTPDSVRAPVKFIDQSGNEIIVYVLNEKGEQIQVTDSKEILNSILQNTGTEYVEDYDSSAENIELHLEDQVKSKLVSQVQHTGVSVASNSEEFVLRVPKRNHKNKASSQTRQKRSLRNTDKIKGKFNHDLQTSVQKDLQESEHMKVSLNFYEDRSSKEFSFECPTCKKRFSTKKARNFHTKTHLPNHQRKYQCSTCGSGFHTPDKLSIHMRIHTKERPFVCVKCNKCYSQIGHLKTHLRTHVGYCPFECNQCDKNFFSNAKLTQHVAICHTETEGEKMPVQCKTCGLFYKDTIDLKLHKLEHVNKESTLSFLSGCNSFEGVEIDSGVFRHLKGTNKTEEKRANSLKSLICEICGAVLRGEASLLSHKLTHQSNEEFLCNVCGDAFTIKDQLEKHLTSHVEDGVACNICGVNVKIKALTAHMLRHENKTSMNYQCKKCGKQYKLEYSFMRHVIDCMEEEMNTLLV